MRSLLLILILLSTAIGYSQVVNISFEDQSRSKYLTHYVNWNQREKKGYQLGNEVIQIENGGMSVVKIGFSLKYSGAQHAITIRKLDSSGKELRVNKLENGERAFGPVPTASTLFNNKILVFFFKYVDRDSMKLYMSELDKDKLDFVNPIQILSYKQNNSDLMGGGVVREIILKSSPDSSHLLLMVRGKKEEYFSCVIEKNFNIQRRKLWSIPKSKNLTVTSVFVDNAGNSIAVVSESLYQESSFNGTDAKYFLIQKTNNEEKLVSVESLGLQSDLRNVNFQESKDKSKLFLVGGYAGATGIAGIAMSSVQFNNLKIDRFENFPYPEEFKKRVYDIGFGARRRGDYGLFNADFEVTEFANGELAISGSPLALQDNTNVSVIDGRRSGYVHFFAGPVMVAFVNGKKPPVFTMIPRHQNYNLGSRPICLPYGDKLLVFYNDFEKNINGSLLPNGVHQSASAIFRELSLAYAVINKNGTVELRKVLSNGISRMNFFNTSEKEIVSDKKILIPSASVDKKTNDQRVAVITVL